MENSEQMPENSEETPEKTETSKEKEENPEKKEDAEPEKTPAAKAKARGRPKGSTDKKARIRRIPITPPEEEAPKPAVKAKTVIVQQEPEAMDE